jgi:hypothetical protein
VRGATLGARNACIIAHASLRRHGAPEDPSSTPSLALSPFQRPETAPYRAWAVECATSTHAASACATRSSVSHHPEEYFGAMASRRAAILARRGASCIGSPASRRAGARPLGDLLETGAKNGEFSSPAFSTLSPARAACVADVPSRYRFSSELGLRRPRSIAGGSVV